MTEENKPKFSQEQYDLLLKSSKEKNGCKLWNDWRRNNIEATISLGETSLKGACLREANLKKSDLWDAKLKGAYLLKTKPIKN